MFSIENFKIISNFGPLHNLFPSAFTHFFKGKALGTSGSSDVWHELYDHPNNLQIESDAFCASGLVVMRFLLWEEGSGKQDLRVVVG